MNIKDLYDVICSEQRKAMDRYMELSTIMKSAGKSWSILNEQTHLLGEMSAYNKLTALMEAKCDEIPPKHYELQPKVCPDCFTVLDATAKACPKCGFKFKGYSWEYQIKETNEGKE